MRKTFVGKIVPDFVICQDHRGFCRKGNCFVFGAAALFFKRMGDAGTFFKRRTGVFVYGHEKHRHESKIIAERHPGKKSVASSEFFAKSAVNGLIFFLLADLKFRAEGLYISEQAKCPLFFIIGTFYTLFDKK